MLENRETMLHMFPELFAKIPVREVSSYPADLNRSLMACAPPGCEGKPVVAVLTPGIHNSAYFEHSTCYSIRPIAASLGRGAAYRSAATKASMTVDSGFAVQ